jgi:hypothetical protein
VSDERRRLNVEAHLKHWRRKRELAIEAAQKRLSEDDQLKAIRRQQQANFQAGWVPPNQGQYWTQQTNTTNLPGHSHSGSNYLQQQLKQQREYMRKHMQVQQHNWAAWEEVLAPAPEQAPESDQVLYGWRDFHYEGGVLFSRNMTPWPMRKPLLAHCLKGYGGQLDIDSHQPPHWNCTCGIYAFRKGWSDLDKLRSSLNTPNQVARLLRSQAGWTVTPIDAEASQRVIGRVSLWGKYIEHEDGYRAQWGYPYELFVSNEAAAERLRADYGCDVTVLS